MPASGFDQWCLQDAYTQELREIVGKYPNTLELWLERASEERAFVDELRRLKPDFESRARELITRILNVEDLVERVIDGLRKAGLEIS